MFTMCLLHTCLAHNFEFIVKMLRKNSILKLGLSHHQIVNLLKTGTSLLRMWEEAENGIHLNSRSEG